ncbi:hypothetical protein [Vreelandella venusta]|uniref:Uncharacterized protein n=1 Tax=Vreelandella venusta TaxID=44935 RepID=A0ABX2BBN9_9GAMM|nr:hypothetical protein [Halomonas venusta]AZM96619.1 hypothetical protein EI420_13455 [Halomonas venusta]NPT30061.1 hypothetical protein [Halomonas venusta]UQI39357.1 hypothetical protein M3L73_14120 [Halomonas venusta]
MEINKHLVVAETIFCDVETDVEKINMYFERMKLCLLSIDNINVDNFDYKHLLYVSDDKKELIDRLRKFICERKIKFVEVVLYSHPEGGYLWSSGDHVDLVKNPNRTSGYRNKLFDKANIDYEKYSGFLRVAIDDDDVWLSDHLANLLRLGICLSKISRKNSLVAGGVFSTYIAKVDDFSGEVELNKVELDRAVCGNKFYYSECWSKICSWSPWSIPDVIDFKSIEKFKKSYGIELFSLSKVDPGFVYFRRGSNLSSQNKSWCTTELISKTTLSNEESVIQLSQTDSGKEYAQAIVNGANKHHDFAHYNESEKAIMFDITQGGISFDDGMAASFYLYCNGVFKEKINYSKERKGSFLIVGSNKGDYFEVVCFIRANSINSIRLKSSKIYLK